MSEETQMSTEEAAQRRQDEVNAMVSGINESAEERALDILRKTLDNVKQAKPESPAADEKRTLIDAATTPATETRPALSAGRVHSAGDARYALLPAWQREFRNPDIDYQIARFFRALAHKDMPMLREVRADLAEGLPAADGGSFQGTAGQLLPLPIANFILNALYRQARMRSWCRVMSTTAASVRIPIQDLASQASWGAESAAIDRGDPTYATGISLVLQKLSSLSVCSNELLEDEAFGVAQWLISDVSMFMAETEDEALYASGTGNALNQPEGFELAETASGVQGTISYAQLVGLFYSLPEPERRNAIWSAPDSVAQHLSLLVDGNLRPILREMNAPGGVVGDAIASGQTGTIMGRPFVNLPGKEGSTDETENRLYFWNPMRSYAILERGDIRVAASQEAGFANDSTHFRFIRRVDGKPIGNQIAGREQWVFQGGINGVA